MSQQEIHALSLFPPCRGRLGWGDGHDCEQLFHALVVFSPRTGIVHGRPASQESEGEEDVHYFGVEQTARIVADSAGLFISDLQVGRWLQAGELIGHVFDGFDGRLRAEVKTPVSGLLSGIRRQPLLFEGDLIARIQTRQAVAAEAHGHLDGQRP